MRFYLDEDLSDEIAVIARSRGLHVLSSHECMRNSSSDESQLLFAAVDGLCLVTKNGQDFRSLTTTFMEQQLPHAGVLVIPSSLDGSEFAAIVDRLSRWNEMYPDGASSYFFGFL
jgi:hypothetical protein